MSNLKETVKKLTPKIFLLTYRYITNPGDVSMILSFLSGSKADLSFGKRISVIRRLFNASYGIDCHHTETEVMSFMKSVMELDKNTEGCVVEAGCFKGGSTAKFSIAAKLAARKLIVFDSFEGIPDNDEDHGKNIFGGPAHFPEGSYMGTMDEVKKNVSKYGEIDSCEFVKGFFENSMPGFNKPVAAVYIDVDLASSTQTCLKYLYPLLTPGGVLYSQDGHLPLVLEVFNNDEFWENEVGFKKPAVEGFGTSKLIKVTKPLDAKPLVKSAVS